MSILDTLFALNRVVKLQFSTRSRGQRVSRKPVFERILQDFGLEAKPDALKEVSSEEAKRVLAYLLHRDLAYVSEILSIEKATEYAGKLMDMISIDGASFYISRELSEKDGKPSFEGSWQPFTNSTFDVGVLAMSDRYAACVWIEDED